MAILFSKNPGCQESHLKRMYRNDLLKPPMPITQDMVNDAHQQDLQELEAFRDEFVKLMNQAVSLQPNSDSETILKLKEDLDRLYEQCSGLTGNVTDYKNGIQKLTRVVMQAVRAGAGDDPTAQAELAQEEVARAQHYELLEIPLVSHLLRPDSPIAEDQLVAVLLGEDVDDIRRILTMFDHEQLVLMRNEAEQILDKYTGAVPGAPFAGSILGLLQEISDQVTRH